MLVKDPISLPAGSEDIRDISGDLSRVYIRI